MGPDDVKELMSECGKVLDVQIIKDKSTGAHKGCCFVIYERPEESEAAIIKFHNHHTLESMSAPMQVKAAYNLSAVSWTERSPIVPYPTAV